MTELSPEQLQRIQNLPNKNSDVNQTGIGTDSNYNESWNKGDAISAATGVIVGLGSTAILYKTGVPMPWGVLLGGGTFLGLGIISESRQNVVDVEFKVDDETGFITTTPIETTKEL